MRVQSACGGRVVAFHSEGCTFSTFSSECDVFLPCIREEAVAAGRVALRPGGDAAPAPRRGPAEEEAARLVPAAARGAGTVGEDPRGAPAAAAAHGPRQGGRFGRETSTSRHLK